MPIATEPSAKCPSRFLTKIARETKLDGMRNFYKHETPDTVSFVSLYTSAKIEERRSLTCSCRPAAETFPITGISVQVRNPGPYIEGVASGSAGESTNIDIVGRDLAQAVQYGQTNGIPELRELLVNMQSEIHKRPKGDWGVVMGNGCQDLIWKCFNACISPGDSVICETPMYTGCLPGLWSLNANCIEVEVDEFGLSAKKLDCIMSNWPSDRKQPRVIYTNPIGGNPSGCSATVERKLEILALCAKYDMLIVEDDPYYYLTTELIPSYFELETRVIPEGGHVMRFDAFSKILSGGMRLGFVSGPEVLLNAIEVRTAEISLFASNISQMIAMKILQQWGMSGFMENAYQTALFYQKKREWFEPLAHKYLDGLAEWQSPLAGLFLWIDCAQSGVEDSTAFMYSHGIPNGVLACPGQGFYPSKSASSHLRVSYSEVTKEEAERGFQRLALALKAFKGE